MAGKYNVKVQYAAWMAVVALTAVVVMTVAHMLRELNAAERETRTRLATAARTLAKAVESSIASNNTRTLPSIVAHTIDDEEILYMRIFDKAGAEVYRPGLNRDTTGLLLTNVPIGSAANALGRVEMGIGQATTSARIMSAVLQDLAVGMLVVGAAVGLSFLASGPVCNALRDLQGFVKRLAASEGRHERLDSDLKEVDQVGAVLNDVVARVSDAQQRLARAQNELKAAQKEMDEYTYVISHDLKEPLRGIDAFSKFLVDDYRDRLDEEGRHKIDVIRQSALRMQRLINDLLKFSRIGQQKAPMVPIGLNAMLMHVRVNLQYALDAKKAELHVEKLPTVVCEATAMTEVFHNLISNAIKYNNKPNPVVEVGCVEQVNPETGAIEYLFHVRDNGVGIKPEYFEKIFQIFQRLHRDQEGTGIGLTIVKRVIEWHGGRIWLESTEGEGTTFYFTLPKREVSKTGTIIETPALSAGKEGGHVATPV
jgi:signal transduction histidine kinase